MSFYPGVIPPGSQYDRRMAHRDRYLLPRCGSLSVAKASRSRGCAGSIGHGCTHAGLLAHSQSCRGHPSERRVAPWSARLLRACQRGPGSPSSGDGGAHEVLCTFCYPPNVTGCPNAWGYS